MLLIWVHSILLVLWQLAHAMSVLCRRLLHHGLGRFGDYGSLVLDFTIVWSFSTSLHVGILGSWSTTTSNSRSSCGYRQVLWIINIRMLLLLSLFWSTITFLTSWILFSSLLLRVHLCVTIRSRLVTIVDDESGLVYIQMCRCSGIVKVVAISLRILWITTVILLFHSLLTLIHGIGWILKRLLYYFLIGLVCLLILYYTTLFLNLLVFREQFLLQVLVLSLVFIWSKMSIVTNNVCRSTLELIFHL